MERSKRCRRKKSNSHKHENCYSNRDYCACGNTHSYDKSTTYKNSTDKSITGREKNEAYGQCYCYGDNAENAAGFSETSGRTIRKYEEESKSDFTKITEQSNRKYKKGCDEKPAEIYERPVRECGEVDDENSDSVEKEASSIIDCLKKYLVNQFDDLKKELIILIIANRKTVMSEKKYVDITSNGSNKQLNTQQLNALKQLSELLHLVESIQNEQIKAEFSIFSSLSVLSDIEGLNELSKLSELSKLN